MLEWNLTAKTIMSKKNWKKTFSKNEYFETIIGFHHKLLYGKKYIRNFDDKQKLFLNRGYYIFDITEKKLINRIKIKSQKKFLMSLKQKKI